MARSKGQRVSQHYNLGRRQSELDFVDVYTVGDVPLFIDAYAIRTLPTPWAQRSVSLIQNFFSAVLDAIKTDHFRTALDLLSGLVEPNETHLGLSSGPARGHGLGGGSLAEDVAKALSSSRAVQTGVLRDLEDTILLIPYIGPDIVSDIATNLIREPLIEYTQDVAQRYGIPLEQDVETGPLWDPEVRRWRDPDLRPLPVANGKRLLLVPKIIVRRNVTFDPDEYFNAYIIPFLRQREIEAGSELVQLLKTKQVPHVWKYQLVDRFGAGKETSAAITLENPELLDRYREEKERAASTPMDHAELADALGAPPPDWDGMWERVRAVPRGRDDATNYHRAIETLLSAIFYPDLVWPTIEREINEGRKRVDIVYTNDAQRGFFAWLARTYTCPFVFVEAKNYDEHDPANPEIDQAANRLSRNRGMVAILVCREIQNRELLEARCRDIANSDQKYIILLDDDDVRKLTMARKTDDRDRLFELMKARFEPLVL